jgi:hypothetical protein
MKKLMIGIVGVLAFGVLAASAFAGNGNTVWLCNGQFLTGTGNNRCLTVSENLTAVVLQDMNESSGIECAASSVLDEGWVGPGSEDETTKVEFMEECTSPANALNLAGTVVTNVCSGKGKATAINLPWLTLVYLEGSLTRDIIKGSTAGKEPGYTVECTVGGLKVKDTCTTAASNEAHIELNNLPAEGSEPALVDVLFKEALLNVKEAATCSLGGAESGLVEGEVLLAAMSGSSLVALEFSEE